jgi:hypothetical protein
MSRIRKRAAIVGVSAVIVGSLGAVTSPAHAARCEASPAHQLLCFVKGEINEVTCEYEIPNPTHQCP